MTINSTSPAPNSSQLQPNIQPPTTSIELFKNYMGKKYNQLNLKLTSNSSALKIAGLVVFSGLAAIALKSVFDGFQQSPIDINANNKPCFEMNKNNVELILQAGKGNTTAYDLLTKIENCPIPLELIKNHHLNGIEKEKFLSYGATSFINEAWESSIIILERLRHKQGYTLLSNHQIENQIDHWVVIILDQHEMLKEFEGSNNPLKYTNIRAQYNERLAIFIASVTEMATEGDLDSMQLLEKLNTNIPEIQIPGIEQIRISFNEAVAKEKAQKDSDRELKIQENTPKAIEGNKWAMDRLEALHQNSPIQGIEQIRILFKLAKIEQRRDDLIEYLERATNGIPGEASFWMKRLKNILDEFHDKYPKDTYEKILNLFLKHTQKNKHVEILTEKAKTGDSRAMEYLDDHESVSKVKDIEQIRISYKEALYKINIEKYTADAKNGDKTAMLKQNVLHEKSPINDIETIRASFCSSQNSIED